MAVFGMISFSSIEYSVAITLPAIVAAIQGFRHARKQVVVRYAALQSTLWSAIWFSALFTIIIVAVKIANSTFSHADGEMYFFLPLITGVFIFIHGILPSLLTYKITRKLFDKPQQTEEHITTQTH